MAGGVGGGGRSAPDFERDMTRDNGCQRLDAPHIAVWEMSADDGLGLPMTSTCAPVTASYGPSATKTKRRKLTPKSCGHARPPRTSGVSGCFRPASGDFGASGFFKLYRLFKCQLALVSQVNFFSLIKSILKDSFTFFH